MYILYFVVFSNNAYFGKSESQLSKVEKEKGNRKKCVQNSKNICQILFSKYFRNKVNLLISPPAVDVKRSK